MVLTNLKSQILNMGHIVQHEIVKYVLVPCLSIQTADVSVTVAGNSSGLSV